jgi:hypothetical protein
MALDLVTIGRVGLGCADGLPTVAEVEELPCAA